MSRQSTNPVAINVVIPTHKGRDGYVERIFQCLAEQSFKGFNVIISDNDSDKKAPPAYLGRYSDLDIAYHINEKDVGPLVNMTRALALCQAEYINMIMSDDLIAPTFLEESFHALQNNPKAGLAFSHRVLIDDNEDIVAKANYHSYSNLPSGLISGKQLIRDCIDIFEWFPGEPTNVLLKNGLLEPKTPFQSFKSPAAYSYKCSCDLILYLKILSQKDAYFINKPLSMIRQHSDRLSHTKGTICHLDYFHFANDAKFLGIIDEEIYFKTVSTIMKFISLKLQDFSLEHMANPVFTQIYIHTILEMVEKETGRLERHTLSRDLMEIFFQSLRRQVYLNISAYLQKKKKKVYGYGTGDFARQLFLKKNPITQNIDTFIDSRSERAGAGQEFMGRPVIHIDDIHLTDSSYILILSSFFQEISSILQNRGFREIEDFCYIPFLS